MKFIIDDSKYIVFHHKTVNISLEDYIHKLLHIIKNRFNVNINGYYDVNIYTNKKYGEVIEMTKEDLSYYDLFTDKIDMQINIIRDTPLLLKIKDIYYKDIYLDNNIIKYNNNYYIDIDNIKDISLYENGQIIYGDIVKKIM